MSKTSNYDLVYDLSPGIHLYQFYKSREDYLRVMIPYFQAGLEKGEACLWLLSERMGFEEVCSAIDAAIPNSLFYRARGQFQIFSAEEWYLTKGFFDEAKSMANAEKMLKRIQKEGFHVLRGAGDAGAIPRSEWPKLEEYERKAACFIQSSPIIALCAYPILECTLPETKAVVECHDSVLIGRL